MKKLGLIGGVGPETTLKYYKEIEYGVMERLGENVLPRITIESLSCFRMIPLGAAQDYEGMTDYIMGAVDVLEKAGCDFIALACITGHMVLTGFRNAALCRWSVSWRPVWKRLSPGVAGRFCCWGQKER